MELLEEEKLVNDLKSCCYKSGREKDTKRSAEVMKRLGIRYWEMSQSKIDKFQMRLNVIQSCALLNASVARGCDQAKSALRLVCSELLLRAGAVEKGADLVAEAAACKEKAKEMRNLSDLFDTLQSIRGDKAKTIKAIIGAQESITNSYKALMRDLMHRCVNILGNPPCKFALVGMGSIARKEITPYSDFEHVFLLEEEIQRHVQFDNIMEYFRWLAVVFLVVIVNMGETVLTSVSIPGINDSSPDGENWFYDKYTPHGISFDSYKIHSSKWALGRPGLELIRPLDMMIELLTKEDELNHGYHMGDILTKTCLVYGDISLYKEFENKVFSHIFESPLSKQMFSILQADIQYFNVAERVSHLIDENVTNVKELLYRTTTVLLSALARVYKLPVKSSFDVIDRLSQCSQFKTNHSDVTGDDLRDWKHAVALSCEIRLRVYSENQSRGDIIKSDILKERYTFVSSIIEHLGEESVVEFFEAAKLLYLVAGTDKVFMEDDFESYNDDQTEVDDGEDENHVETDGENDDGDLEEEDADDENDYAHFHYVKRLGLDYNYNVCMAFGMYQRAIDVNLSSLNASQNIGKETNNLNHGLVKAYIAMRNRKEALRQCETWKSTHEVVMKDTFIYHFQLGECFLDLQLFSQAMSEFVCALQHNDPFFHAKVLVNLGNCLAAISCANYHQTYLVYMEALDEIRATEECCKNMEGSNMAWLRDFLFDLQQTNDEVNRRLTGCLIRKRRAEDALAIVENVIEKSGLNETNSLQPWAFQAFEAKSLCLRGLGRYSDDRALRENMLQLLQGFSSDVEEFMEPELICRISEMFFKLGQKNEALLHWAQGRQLYEKFAGQCENVWRKSDLYNILFDICLTFQQHSDALTYAQTRYELVKQTCLNEPLDMSICDHLKMVRLVLRTIGNETEAQNYLDKETQTLINIRSVETNETIKLCLTSGIATILSHHGRFSEALKLFREELDMRLSPPLYDSESDIPYSLVLNSHDDIARCRQSLGFCLTEVGQQDEALKFLTEVENMQVLCDDNNITLFMLNRIYIGKCHLANKQYGTAIASLNEAKIWCVKISAIMYKDEICYCNRLISESLRKTGSFLQAFSYGQKALQLRQKHVEETKQFDREFALCVLEVGYTLMNIGFYDHAMEKFDDVLAMCDNIDANNHSYVRFLALYGKGQVLGKNEGQTSEANLRAAKINQAEAFLAALSVVTSGPDLFLENSECKVVLDDFIVGLKSLRGDVSKQTNFFALQKDGVITCLALSKFFEVTGCIECLGQCIENV